MEKNFEDMTQEERYQEFLKFINSDCGSCAGCGAGGCGSTRLEPNN